MGMENIQTSFWANSLKNADIRQPEFSLCFGRSNQAGSGDGAMTLGGVDPRLHMSPMVFAENTNKHSGFYSVHLKEVYLRKGGGTSAQTTQEDMERMHKLTITTSELNMGNAIVDSGTTDTYFPRALAGPFKKAWKKLTGNDYNHNHIELSDDEIAKLPTIILILEGYDAVGDEPEGHPNDIAGYVGDTDLSSNPTDVVIAIPATHYMEYVPSSSTYLPRINMEESGGTILGANTMMGHDILFDNALGRIGFAESDCEYSSLLSSEVKSNERAAKSEGINEKSYKHAPVQPGPDQISRNSPNEKIGAIIDEMKSGCSSIRCSGVAGGIAALFILTATVMFTLVFKGIRRAMARRHDRQQYEEAQLHTPDLIFDPDFTIDSDSDEEMDYSVSVT